MEIITINRNPNRQAAVTALAVVGFITLVLVGIGLAIYSARYMPKLASKIGGAAVSLSSVFHRGGEDPTLQVINASSTLPFEGPLVLATSTSATTTTTTVKPVVTAGQTTYTTTVVTQPVAPYGDPDLAVSITDVGYLRRDGDTGSFVAASTIDASNDGAVKFTVRNAGTNVTGSWRFTVDIPSNPSQTFTSPSQKSLNPGDSIDYVLGFEKGKKGDNRVITVTVDSRHEVDESSESNNEDSQSVDINS